MNPHDDRLSSHSVPTDSYLVAMLGAAGVGKCALLSQFRTSECINAYETGRGEMEHPFIVTRKERRTFELSPKLFMFSYTASIAASTPASN